MSIQITEEDILRAQSAVLPQGVVFNLQQREFIACLDSCSVQAYAGTGKTSTLVAKLHALAQKQVWKDGGSICVLSHTNVAVDEVKKKVAQHFPGIMEYPNFVGTIQEFVNTFLFSPYLSHSGKRIRSQDSSRYIDWRESTDEEFKKRVTDRISQLRGAGYSNDDANGLIYGQLGTIFESNGVIMSRNSQGNLVEYQGLKTKAMPVDRLYEPLKNLIDERSMVGRFLYDESFVGAKKYLEEKPVIINAIRERFKYVFLDEAQDCSELQLEILSTIFPRDCTNVFQQIGDENQEISDDIWKPGDNPMVLSESVRFGASISSFINKFKLSGETDVVGVGSHDTERILITYNDNRKNDILDEYASLIQERAVPYVEDEGFYAIAPEHKVLEEFYSNYSKQLARKGRIDHRTSFKNDNDYLSLLKRDLLVKFGQNHIFNTLFSILYKHYREGGEWYQLRRLVRNEEHSEIFKKLVQEVSFDVLENGLVTNVGNINRTLNTILGEEVIGLVVQSSVDELSVEQNLYISTNNLKIKLGTIHSVKGQTHNATLFLSSVYGSRYKKSDFGWAGHDSEVNTPRYKKLIYVASSRPRQLFVVAMSTEEYLNVHDKNFFDGFGVVNLT